MKSTNIQTARFLSGLISLAAILFGFWLLNDTIRSILWLLFVVISYPVILALFMRPDSLGTGDIRSMYRDGVRSLPIVSKLFRPSQIE